MGLPGDMTIVATQAPIPEADVIASDGQIEVNQSINKTLLKL